MAEYVYTTVPGKIRPLLEKMRTVGIPPRVSGSWLKSLGYTSSNDASLISVLKFVGLTDQSGVPTSTWNSYRGAQHKAVLGEAIRKGYQELYAFYPDAHARSNTDLTHVFSTSSSAGAQAISKTVATFRALVDEAEFSSIPNSSQTTLSNGPLHTPPSAGASPHVLKFSQSNGGPEVHIDIQIHISPESTSQQIEKIFESMAKHLYGRKDE